VDQPTKRPPVEGIEAFAEEDRSATRPLEPPRRHRPSLPESITAPFENLTIQGGPPDHSATRPTARPERPLLKLFPAEQTAMLSEPAASIWPTQSRRDELEPVTASDADVFYGLREKAFGDLPDPRFFFHSTPHDAVVQQLLTAIRRREGLVVLTGAAGVGKSITCRVVVEQIDRRTLTSFVAGPVDAPEQLLTQILSDFGVLSRVVPAPARAAADLRQALQSFVESLGAIDASAVVFVDDAQDLSSALFAEVRRLCEAAHVSSRLQVVLVGSDALRARLRRKENRALHERIVVRCTLLPLPAEEVGDYVAHRLSVAGNARVELEEDALARIFQLSSGVPRQINAICEAALAHGRASSAGLITEALIDLAATDVGLGTRRTATVLIRIGFALLVIVCLAAGAAAAAWVFRDSVARAVTSWQRIPRTPDAPRRLPSPLRVPGDQNW
jgi:type II secretory pathway predicted ATPase ExeA